MKRRFTRTLALLAMILFLVGVGLLGIGAAAMYNVFVWQIQFAFFLAFIAVTILMWFGIEMHSPLILKHHILRKLDATITPLLTGPLFVATFAFVGKAVFTLIFGPWPMPNFRENFTQELFTNANTAAGIAGFISIILLATLWERLGFCVQRIQKSEKAKRNSRIDALFADLSDAEVHELRQRLIAIDDDRLTEACLNATEWYEEKAKRNQAIRYKQNTRQRT